MRLKYGLAVLLLGVVAAASAMTSFRRHKFDLFDALPLCDNAVVFYGNSITNMHEWWEALGSDPRFLNRGASGAMTFELLEKADCVARLHPAKVLVGIGTNDLGNENYNNPDSIAENIAGIVNKILAESPSTEVFVQSILPSENGIRTLDAIAEANAKIKVKAEEAGATFIDLTGLMQGIVSREYSYDGLHITSKGYARWLDFLEPLLGKKSVYSQELTEDNGGIPSNSFGMRNTYFSAYPLYRSDIVFMGDELIHGCEWHEMLADARIKNRGTGWGYGGMSLSDWKNALPAIFSANGNKEAPEKVFLYVGTEELYRDGMDVDNLLIQYKELLQELRHYLPADSTQLVVMSLIPRQEASLNRRLTVPFNEKIKEMVKEDTNAHYLDLYSLLSNGPLTASPGVLDENFLTAAGYRKIVPAIRILLGHPIGLIYDRCDRHSIDVDPSSSGRLLERVMYDTRVLRAELLNQ